MNAYREVLSEGVEPAAAAILAGKLYDLRTAVSPIALTPDQAAKRVGKSVGTVRRWCKAGLIGKKVSGPDCTREYFLIHPDQLDQFMKSGEPVKLKASRRGSRRPDPDVIEFFQ